MDAMEINNRGKIKVEIRMLDIGQRYKAFILKVTVNIDIVKPVAFQIQSTEAQIRLKISIFHIKTLTAHVEAKRGLAEIIGSQ